MRPSAASILSRETARNTASECDTRRAFWKFFHFFAAHSISRSEILRDTAARNKIYTAEPDIEGAIKLLTEAVAINSKKFSNAIELGNQYLKLGKREESLQAYRIAKENAPADNEISELIARQIERVTTEPLEQITPLRNPEIE